MTDNQKAAENAVRDLVTYGVMTGLIPPEEIIYSRNLLLHALRLDSYEAGDTGGETLPDLEATLAVLLDYAVQQGIIEDSITDRDLFDTLLMNCLTPRPATVIAAFREKYADDPRQATDWYYRFSQDSDYIRRYRIKKDQRWKTPTQYGDLDITINLSKPEKDPKAIAAAGKTAQTSYPKCQLCVENEGYSGRADHPARETLRIMPITIGGQPWGFQYSPYTYYNEHCIALNTEHVPMRINYDTFVKLFDFVKLFPHYFIGSNADLPIVGGSILSHDHFQGGSYEFAMAKAPIEHQLRWQDFPDVEAGIVRWPMSVIRLRGRDEKRIIELADRILTAWRAYTDERAYIFAHTDGEPHNTITPIARKNGEDFELDLVLRNNITTPDRPLGLYHPRNELHHIKKENIGLIEVMGLAVLPARLAKEIEAVQRALLEGRDLRADPLTEKHADWAEDIRSRTPDLNESNIGAVMKQEIGEVFAQVLEDAGVFKRDEKGQEAFRRFAAAAGAAV